MEGKNKKTKVFKWAAVMMLAAMMIGGCKQAQGNSSSAENKKPDTPAAAEKYAVSFEAATLGGELTAKVDGAAITSGASVEKGKTVTFTASPLTGYKVEKWEVNGKAVNGTALSYTLTVNEVAKVKVFFTKDGTPITEYTVTIPAVSNGKVVVEPGLSSDNKVPEGQVLTFTAKAAAGYAVDTWTVTPSEVLQTGGKAGEATATVKVNADTTVKVTFKLVASPTPSAPAGSYNAVTGEGIVGGVKFMMKKITAVTNGNLGHSDESDNRVHTVSLTAYRIGETEVTQELWQAVMGENPSWFKGTGNLPDGSEVQGKRPVEQVSWYQCIAFCNELTKQAGLEESECLYYSDAGYTKVYTKEDAGAKKEVHLYTAMNKKGFRLPTEAEWEWAAKGGTEDKWAGTNEKVKLGDYAWYNENGDNKTHQVKMKKPNGYGLYDMSGNVWEWCWDWYSSTTPAGGQTDPQGAASGRSRVRRGGGWSNSAERCFVGIRNDYEPGDSHGNLGFRVACRP